MRLLRRTTRRASGQQPWGRARLIAVLSVAALAALSLVAGLGLAITFAFASASGPDPRSAAGTTSAPGDPVTAAKAPSTVGDPRQAQGQQARRSIAAEPMLDAGPTGYRPTAPGTTVAGTIMVPTATGVGPAQVPTGFPRTPQGAVAQLAAIDTTVLQGMDIRLTTQVYQSWAAPGGVGPAQWSMTQNVAVFLGATSNGTRMEPTTVVTATPVAGQVKGVDGPDWVVACVLLAVRATVRTEAAIGYGHCEQMVWQAGRWMIAPGEPAAPGPSTWPGTEAARRAGWLDWVQEAS